MNELQTIDGYCDITKTGLTFKRDVSKEEWQHVFDACNHISGCIQFWIGDLLKYREQKWGMYDDVAEETGIEIKTLKKYKGVSDGIEKTLRRDDLSFSHHEQVAYLPELKQIEFLKRASEEKLSVRELRGEIRKEKFKDKKPSPIPEGTFNIIYCDPPWQYDFAETDNRKIENQYPTMTMDELCEMKLPSIEDNALILMWATAPKLVGALRVMEAWGFEYKTHSIWDKGKIGMGYWFRGQHELLLVGTRGNFSPPNQEDRNSSIYCEDRTQHSRKPDFYYEWIEKSFTGNKIELFARTKRKGWEVWGNESI